MPTLKWVVWAYEKDERGELKSHPPNCIPTADLGLFCHQLPPLHAGRGQSLNYIAVSWCLLYTLVRCMLPSHFLLVYLKLLVMKAINGSC